MTYTISPQTAGDSYRGIRVIAVVIEEADAGFSGTFEIPHTLGRVPLMVWSQTTGGSILGDQPPMWFVDANDTNVLITAGAQGFVVCRFNVYLWTPFPQSMLVA